MNRDHLIETSHIKLYVCVPVCTSFIITIDHPVNYNALLNYSIFLYAPDGEIFIIVISFITMHAVVNLLRYCTIVHA